MKCKQHGINFGYTCGICETEYVYVGRTHLLDAFRAGVKGQPYPTNDIHEQAAYQHGVESKAAYKKPTVRPVRRTKDRITTITLKNGKRMFV